LLHFGQVLKLRDENDVRVHWFAGDDIQLVSVDAISDANRDHLRLNNVFQQLCLLLQYSNRDLRSRQLSCLSRHDSREFPIAIDHHGVSPFFRNHCFKIKPIKPLTTFALNS